MDAPPPPGALRRRFRHARRWTGYGALVVLIAFALLVAIANQLLPMVERHPDRIAAWLGERVGEPVRFSAARAEWTRRGPRFILEGLHVGDASSPLDIGRAQLQVAMYSGLLPGQPLTELKIRDLALTLVQDPDGRWRVVGLPGQGGGGDPFERLEGFGELHIERARLAIRAPRLKLSVDLPRVDARIRVNGPRVRAGLSGWMTGDGVPLEAVLELDRRGGNGLLWAGGRKLQLAAWSPALASAGITATRGDADLGVWARLRDRRVDQVTVEADVRQPWLRAVAPLRFADGRVRALGVSLDRVEARARWDATPNGWRVVAPRLAVTRAGRVASLDRLEVEGGKRFRLVGDALDLSPLAAMLSLSDRIPPDMRAFLQEANPQAQLRAVRVEGARGGAMHGRFAFSDLRLQPQGNRPGLRGAAGSVEFDQRGGVLRVQPGRVRMDWPVGFRQPVEFQLAGTLGAWREGKGWTVGTHRLSLRGEDFGARLRLQLGFQGDGSKPALDLAADLDPASFATAKRFWIMHRMSPNAVKWLDRALVSGRVLDGRVALAGDLDDWPFRDGKGRFDARASVRDATVAFSPDWPAGEAMNLDLVFDGPGFSLAGNGAIAGNPVAEVRGGVAAFAEGQLLLDVRSDTRAEALRALLRASPLAKQYGEHLENAQVAGPAQVAVAMQFPLRPTAPPQRIEGTLDLADASLADPRWDVAFAKVSGRTRFDREGFATENLRVLFANQPGVFNLRVGAATGERGLAALATLDGRFTAASLIARDDGLAWLQPWISGTSPWRIAVRVPSAVPGGRAPPSRLSVSSDLVGTALLLPAPLRKPEPQALRLELQAPLPVHQGELALRLGNLMRMRAQLRENAAMSAAIGFGDATPPSLPADGISVRGNVPSLDATGWVAFAGRDAPAAGGAKPSASEATLRDVDVRAQQLLFLDRGFADARVALVRGSALTQVRFDGTGIEGSIDVPNDAGRAVQGRFARLHLPASAPTGAGSAQTGASPAAVANGARADAAAAGAAAVPPSAEVENPGDLPPLRFEIADLRLGAAQLGKAELQTTPIANGLRIDRFQTTAKNLAMSAAGEWVRAPAGTRSNFRIDFSARSLGQMLDALGFADMVQGGPTKATLTGSWPGSPGAFALATLSGTLKADIGEGRLLDVEPGGSGRILGLISLAEIPRRLSLDFSDFFEKGFSFNTARGDFSFSDGTARTDNLRIDGPAAEIRVSGATGLRDQVYDQRVEVLPKAGGILPAIGLLAAGPAGAAVGAMAQAVLQKPLKQGTRVLYRVTGPWAKPVVKVIEKGPRRPGPQTAATEPELSRSEGTP